MTNFPIQQHDTWLCAIRYRWLMKEDGAIITPEILWHEANAVIRAHPAEWLILQEQKYNAWREESDDGHFADKRILWATPITADQADRLDEASFEMPGEQ